jgi:hypothetical protein
VPRATIGDIPPAEQARLLAAVRRARYGSVLALPLLVRGAAGRPPPEIAAVLCGSRSTVDRVVRASRAGDLQGLAEAAGLGNPRARRTGLPPCAARCWRVSRPRRGRAAGGAPAGAGPRWPWRCGPGGGRSLGRGGAPRAPGGGLGGEAGPGGAKEDEPRRVEARARRRSAFAQWRAGPAPVFADEGDRSLLPQGGSPWLPPGAQGAGRTPGTTETRSVAGALDLTTGTTPHGGWDRQTPGRSLALLTTLDRESPARAFAPRSVGVANSKSHSAGEGEQGGAAPPRFALLSLPTSGPTAKPIERAFGEVPAKWTRTQPRQRLGPLARDVEQQLQVNGPWPSALSRLYYPPEVTAAVEALRAADSTHEEISHLAA